MESKTNRVDLLKSVIDELQTYYAIQEGVTGVMRYATLELAHATLSEYKPETDIEKGLVGRIVAEVKRAMNTEGEKQFLSVRIAHIQAEKLLSALLEN